MMIFGGRCFLLVILFAFQGSSNGIEQTIVTNLHENVSLVYHITSPDELRYLYRRRTRLMTTNPYAPIANFFRLEDIDYNPGYPYPFTVEVYKGEGYVNISVFFVDVVEEQSNNYILSSPVFDVETRWKLYVVDIQKEETAGTSVYMNQFSPLKTETLTRMKLNMTLFFDGLLVNSPYSYMFVHPQLNNKTFVNEIADANGNRTNITSVLHVAYLSGVGFDPSITAYWLRMKDQIPSVKCIPDCSPQCEVIWKKDGEMVADSATLNFGEANIGTTGEYICIVTNNYITHQLSRSLYIFVQDDREVRQLWVFVSVLCAVLVLTNVALIVALICIGRRYLGSVKHETRPTKTSARKQIPQPKPKSTPEAHGVETTDGCYETKQSSMGNEHDYCDIELKPDGNTVTYQNTAMVDDQPAGELYESP